MRRFFEVILYIFIIIFLIGITAMGLQVIGGDSPNKATIFGGLLSMIGGAIGALGAYFVASNQMNKQFEYEKKKEKSLKIEQIKKTLKKLQLLNDYALFFVAEFVKNFNKPYSEELDFKLKSSETAILWIVDNINNVNDELLNEGFMLDYIKLNYIMNHTYSEIIVFNNLPEEQKAHNLLGLIETMHELGENFNTFGQYVEEQLEELEKLNFNN